jgi:predicted  nucleic acid-binding Zn-ribbon protein
VATINKNEMSKIEKKKEKLKERIEILETELRMSLTKKTSTTKEINVPSYQRKIQELKIELQKM